MSNFEGGFFEKIKITNRTQATCNYFNLPLPNLSNFSESYKNSEVDQNNSQILVIDTVAAEKLLNDIEWGVETSNNVNEKAGLLIGYRCKMEKSNMWGLVTDIIPFKYTKSNRRSIGMTSDSFYDASCRVFPKLSEINPDIEIIGWYHTHTYSDQPVFSATDYQTQASTYASIPDCFAIVLNPHQRTFCAYFGKEAMLIKSFFENQELKYNFSINETYYKSKLSFKIHSNSERTRIKINRETVIRTRYPKLELSIKRMINKREGCNCEMCFNYTRNNVFKILNKSEGIISQDRLDLIILAAVEVTKKHFDDLHFSP